MNPKSLRLALVLSLLVPAGAALAKDVRLEKRLPLASGGSFALRSAGGSVTVRGGTGKEAVVVITADREDFREFYDVRFDAQPNRVSVVIERKGKGLFSGLGSTKGRVDVDVALPRQVDADVSSSGGGLRISEIDGNVVLSSSGGSVVAERVRGSVRAESSGGSVETSDIGGAVDLSSSGGPIVAANIRGDVRANTSGGGVRIEEAHGTVQAGSSGGSINVGFASGNARGGDIGSSGGGVSVKVDPAVRLNIDAASSGGRVSSDLPVTAQGKASKTSLRGTLNGGGAVLKLRSSGGGVSLAPR